MHVIFFSSYLDFAMFQLQCLKHFFCKAATEELYCTVCLDYHCMLCFVCVCLCVHAVNVCACMIFW
jgi:hypothetical protein